MEPTDDILEFVERFALDEKAAEYLQSLSDSVRSTVLAEFAPRSDTHDTVGKFYAFAKSVERRLGDAEIDPDAFDAFVARWGLDQSVVNWLSSLPHDVLSIVISQFDPKGPPTQIVVKLQAFARSVHRAPRTQLQAPEERMFVKTVGNARVFDFAMYWGLEDSSVQALLAMDPSVQAIVMDEFDPKGDTQNVNGKLLAFARSIGARKATQMAQTHVQTHVQANVQAQVAQDGDVSGFVHHWGLDETTRLFLMGLPEDVRCKVTQEFAPNPDTRDLDGKLRMFARGILTHSDLSEFAKRWNLDAASVAFMQSLPEEIRSRVMLEFDPRDNTRNVDGKLRAFASNMGTAVAEESESDEHTFLERWGLIENPTAWEVLSKVNPTVRARIMREFDPKQDTRDIFGKFCGFATSVARAAAGGALGRVPAPALVHRAVTNDPEQFASRWQLDEGSRALLRGLDPTAQAIVIQEFQPQGARDISGKFCSFARSVASGRGLKRKLE